MTNYADVEPTEGDVANSYEYIFDIAVIPSGGGTPVWVNVPDITALNPQWQAKLKDITTYANKGAGAQKKVGSDFTLDFNILKVRDLTGEFQPEWVMLKTAQDSDGDANNLLFRFYDALGASDAYQGKAAISRGNRPNTGNDDPGFDNFTLTGVGRVMPILNPTAAPPAAWAATTAYTIGQRVTVATRTLEAIVSGTSGASAPTAPATVGGTVLDGTAAWKRIA